MADLSLIQRTLGDVLRHAELSESDREALEWCRAALATPPSADPWSCEGGQIRNAQGDVIASVPHSLGDMGDDANLRLILAAPALLAAGLEAVKAPELGPRARTELQRALYRAQNGAELEA